MNWLRMHHLSGLFDRKDQFGQPSQSSLDKTILLKMHELDLKQEANVQDARYEEQSFLMAAFSANPGAKDIFIKMFPSYAEEDEEGEFLIPEGPEDIYALLEQAKRDLA